MNPRKQRIEAVFDALVALSSPQQREHYLTKACTEDPQLRLEVEELLQAHERAGGFLVATVSEVDTLPLKPIEAAPSEHSGAVIGRYKLLEKIGEGGMGVVYMAEQREPVVRKVALKIIKLGMDTRSVVARFEAERQALALMDHPNIAKVLDAGATDSGRPYFVMDLVQGLPIVQFCDEAKLSTGGRIELFLEVCSAIQHAHQKGIIHRDIKPSNILVTLHGDKPVPKVIDFGIAKATQGRLTDKTLFTQFQQFIGTPAYMSPEQASLSGLDIDTRSDIYALGVLLYELLTGKTPFDATELMKAGVDEMRRTIREQEPQRPSTRLRSLAGEELTTTAKRRGMESPRLINALKGDVDWIVMKCLEKDRARRYETANDLAADIRRHLSDEPVVARPPSAAYRVRKAIRRNKVAYAAAAAVLLAVAIGFGTTWRALIRERAARREAIQQKELAERRFRGATQFAREILTGVTPKFQDLLGATDGLTALLASSSRFLETIGTDASTDDPYFLKLYTGLLTFQSLFQGSLVLGTGGTDLVSAIETARGGFQLATNLLHRFPTNREYASLVAFSRYAVGEALLGAGRLEEARQNLEAAFDEFSSLSDPRMFQVRRRLGFLCYKEGQYSNAIAIISKAAEVLAEPGAFGLREQFRFLAFAELVEWQGLCYEKLGNIDAAIPLFEKAVTFLAKSQDLEPNNVHCTRDIGTYNSGLGELKMSKGDYAEGSRHFNLGLSGLEDLRRRDPANGGFLVALADSQFRAARSFAKVASGQSFTTAQRAEAQQRAEKALRRCRELIQLPDFPNLVSGLDFRPDELDVVAQQLRDSSQRN